MITRSYTNREGEKIEVTQEHLDVAVKIKKELQMASPSHRCSWVKHMSMMQEEGFEDSDKNESYRCMIKDYQKSIGELPEVDKYADMVSVSKLQSIKEAVGEMAYTKREVQLESQKLNKLKRDLTLYGVIAEEIRNALVEELNEMIPTYVYGEKSKSINSKRMIVVLSDLHIGAVVDNVMGNSYNYNIAVKRLNKFLDNVMRDAKMLGIVDIDVVVSGDITEHVQMRKSQGFSTEFNLGMQIVKSYEIVRNFISTLAGNKFNVTYRGIAGNHDRFEGNKDDNLDGDSTVFVINEMIKNFIEDTDAERLEYVESDEILYSTVIEANGKKIKFVHGDNERGNNILGQHNKMDGDSYDAVVMGHLHHYSVKEVGIDKWEVYFGSTQGSNNYGKKGKLTSTASQGAIIIHEDGEMDFRNYRLQIN